MFEARPSLVIHTHQGSKSVSTSDRPSAARTRKRSPDRFVVPHAWQNAIIQQGTSASLLRLDLEKPCELGGVRQCVSPFSNEEAAAGWGPSFGLRSGLGFLIRRAH